MFFISKIVFPNILPLVKSKWDKTTVQDISLSFSGVNHLRLLSCVPDDG